jgi:hypothetical protein
MKTTIFLYKLISGEFATEWRVALSAEEIAAAIERNNKASDEKTWAAEIAYSDLEPADARRLAGFLLGSQTTGRKAAAARLNGKKGGRPRKDAAKAKKQPKESTLFEQ